MTDKELFSSAFDFFKTGNYGKTIETLVKLSKHDDHSLNHKVLHNIAISTYLHNGCADPKKLLDDLSKIKKRVEDKLVEQEQSNNKSHAEHSETDDSTHGGNNVHHSLEESDTYIITYNQAVLYFQLKQYATALLLLEGLYRNIEPIDEYLSINICFLLIEIYLTLKQREKVPHVINYLEKTFPTLTKDSNNEKNEEHSNNNSSSNNTEHADSTQPGAGHARPSISGEDMRNKIHTFRSRLQLLTKTTQASKREIKLAMGSSSSAANISSGNVFVRTFTSAFIKANLEYQRQNYPKAIKLLNNCVPQSVVDKGFESVGPSILFYNNLGCIHFRMKKHNAAMFYLSKALKYNDMLYNETSSDPKSLPAFSKNKRLEILYNLGYQLLGTGNPELAFQCLQESTLIFYKQPKVWLRLAEACIAHHIKTTSETDKKACAPSVHTLSSDFTRSKIVLPTYNSSRSTEPTLQYVEDSESKSSDDASPVFSQFVGSISLEYGAKCIKNALYLLSRILNPSAPLAVPASPATATANSANANSNPPPAGGSSTTSSSASNSINNAAAAAAAAATPSAQVFTAQNEEDILMRQAALLNGSYIALALNNPVVALSYTTELVTYKKIPDNYKMLAALYGAEALCLLNRPSEAAQFLSPQNLTFLTTAPDSSPFSLPSSPYSSLQLPDPTLNASYLFFVNLAVVHILKDDLPQAQQCVNKALSISQRSLSAQLLFVYLELRRGSVEIALHQIRRLLVDFHP